MANIFFLWPYKSDLLKRTGGGGDGGTKSECFKQTTTDAHFFFFFFGNYIGHFFFFFSLLLLLPLKNLLNFVIYKNIEQCFFLIFNSRLSLLIQSVKCFCIKNSALQKKKLRKDCCIYLDTIDEWTKIFVTVTLRNNKKNQTIKGEHRILRAKDKTKRVEKGSWEKGVGWGGGEEGRRIWHFFFVVLLLLVFFSLFDI